MRFAGSERADRFREAIVRRVREGDRRARMKTALPALVVGILIAQQAAVDAQPHIVSRADYVRVPVAVLDENDRPVTDLRAEDFRLYDEDSPKPISNFVLDVAPVHILFLVDSSGSTKEELPQMRYAVRRFAQHFTAEDRMALAGFSDKFEWIQDWTNDEKRLAKALKRLEPGYRTALWDSLSEAAQRRLAGVDGRRALILMTDGLDNESTRTYDQVLEILTKFDVVLYVVSRSRLVESRIEDSERVRFLDRVMRNLLDEDESFVGAYFRDKEAALENLAATNGGRVFYPASFPALGQIYAQIAQELKTQYVMTFPASTTSETAFRRIRVECLRPVGKLVYRRLYYAR